MIRVLIAEDYAVVRDGLRALINAQPGLAVIGDASTCDEAWRSTCDLKPDVVVLDLSMPRTSGLDAAERIVRDCPASKVLALTMHEERAYVSRMLRAGAAGYVLKRSASAELVRAIRAVHGGERYIDPSLNDALIDDFVARPQRTSGEHQRHSIGLTPRENEVLRLLALGHSNKEIAATLSISVKTVETHRASGMARLGLTTRAALVRFAMNEGWLQDAQSNS